MPTEKKNHDDDCMDLLTHINRVDRARTAKNNALENALSWDKEEKESLKEAQRLAVKIRDSKFVKDDK